ncbi:T-cell surface glycoprotein CD3 epsilon chain-like [Syngnathoides biaculeatus]|uniref:T-cell surface glycoprotein CD3 epsilon chain-like n=1 Tax=Syngnathoides biaculeatus TaxID=300417 RepID=UPI002ADDBD0A|nr:T-cell surface glycoprotein CD3 epsilon chain-like [Syngnathoides biaculeatus]
MKNSILLVGHLLIISAVGAAVDRVSFWREEFTMTCPENGIWFKAGGLVDSGNTWKSYTLPYNGENKGLYYCEYTNLKYYFYVEGKVCSNCFELDATTFGLVIAADVSVTIILMVLIYKCVKPKKNSSPGAKGPAPPSPDYEHLKRDNGSRDPYSFINSHQST